MLVLTLTPESVLPQGTDKAVHFVAFAVFTAMLMTIVPNRAVAVGLAITVALVSEVVQVPMPGRDADFFDLAADLIGIITAIPIYIIGRTIAR
jgi:VanZ family protein